MNANKTPAKTTNFVINRSLDTDEGNWFAKVGKNEVGEKAIIFFQKDQKLSLGMKLALLTGSVKKGEDVAKNYLKELELPDEYIFNVQGQKLLKQRFSEIEANTRGSKILTHEKIITSEKSDATEDVRVKITVKTKEYETAKNEFCKDLYAVFDAKREGPKAEGKKQDLLMYASVFDYLHGSETKASGLILESMILILKSNYDRIQKDPNNDSTDFKHKETIQKILGKYEEDRKAKTNFLGKYEEDRKAKTNLKDLRDLQTNPNLDIARKNLRKFR